LVAFEGATNLLQVLNQTSQMIGQQLAD